MSSLQADMRSAAVDLLTAYGQDNDLRLQVYPARPRSINPPCAFVDTIRESISYSGPSLRQRVPSLDVIVLHGYFDSAEAAHQKDAFVDGFLDWCTANPHIAGANTVAGVTETEDIPNYVPDWMAPELQKTYYATRITLEGYAEN